MTATFFLMLCGMLAATYISRAAPLQLLSQRELNPFITRWLTFVPPAVLAALLAPSLTMQAGALHVAADNPYLLAAVPATLVAWCTGSFFGAIAAGMAAVAGARLLGMG